MNWIRIEGSWQQVTGSAKAHSGKLSGDNFKVVAGRRDQLAGKIQEHYGVAQEVANKQISEWIRTVDDSWFK